MTITQTLLVPVRLVLTAYGFLQFGLQVIWLGKWQMPRIMAKGESKQKALFAAHQHVVRYLSTLTFLRLVKFRFEGQPSQQPCVVVANHPSLLDFIVLLRDLPNTVCLYKPANLNNPVLGSFVQVAGYIEGLDSGSASANRNIITAAGKRLKEGHQVTFFPEGTRSPSARALRRFRTTAFHAAIRAGAPVQPVAILCTPMFLGKNQKWLSFATQTNQMHLRYLPLVHPADLPEAQRTAKGLAQAVHASISRALSEMANER